MANNLPQADDIRARINIVDIIGKYTPLKKAGGSTWRGSEHPSLAVDESRQLYRWYSHDEHGDVFEWVMQREHIVFRAAIESLAHSAYVCVTPLPRPAIVAAPPPPPLSKVELAERGLSLPNAAAAWQREGFSADDCAYWHFGYVPDLWSLGAALVIPNFYRGELMSIKYRLLNRDADKYRSEGAAHLFNRDMLDASDDAILVEGEKKAAYLTNRGLIAIGLPGVNSFKPEWLESFEGKRVTLALDDGINPYALTYPRMIADVSAELRIMCLPVKPDDWFTKYGGTIDAFIELQRTARKWRKAVK